MPKRGTVGSTKRERGEGVRRGEREETRERRRERKGEGEEKESERRNGHDPSGK